jgi:1-acyl-sn-glycerol-3-phosphate acyltransferase
MLATLRMLARLFAGASLTIGWFALWELGRPLHRGERRLAWRRWIYSRWARSVCATIGMRRRRVGPAPSGPCMLVCNHQGWVDVLFLAAELGAVFVSKAEIRGWPVLGHMSEKMGTLFVAREAKRELPEVNRTIARSLEEGEIIAIFPEATSTTGASMLPFRAPLFESAANARARVQCAAIRYRTGRDPERGSLVGWGDAMPFGRHVARLLGLRGFDAEVALSSIVLESTDRKELAAEAEREVRRLFDAQRSDASA